MSQSNSWFQQTPPWVWLSFIPGFGGLSIAYAGHKSNTNSWVGLGIGITGLSFLLSSTDLSVIIWLSQIGISFYLKKFFLVKTYPKNLPIPQDDKLAKMIAIQRPKLDINECSKNDLVNVLGLPIAYASNIESLQNEGYIFTHLEELTEIAAIPEHQIARIAPLITFSYNYKKEADASWKRLNIYSTQDLITCGLDEIVAEKIVVERERNGEYKSLIDVKQRTGLPFTSYRQII
ncbi:MAG: helix-hairpin-helix domain-containing protein [Nostocaceae cyanobacterium]|nr:helix-hairpin-helix domain-containing protein [Nostocaceae cyanobacterium]